jgi:hypothetical protein
MVKLLIIHSADVTSKLPQGQTMAGVAKRSLANDREVSAKIQSLIQEALGVTTSRE